MPTLENLHEFDADFLPDNPINREAAELEGLVYDKKKLTLMMMAV